MSMIYFMFSQVEQEKSLITSGAGGWSLDLCIGVGLKSVETACTQLSEFLRYQQEQVQAFI